jgi:hypothetical protein
VKRRLSDLTSAAAVQAALDEFVRIGRDAFLVQYGFKRARDYFVIDPKLALRLTQKPSSVRLSNISPRSSKR